jgi:hypothetical protein
VQTVNKLSDLVKKVSDETFAEFADKQLRPNDLAISLIDLTNLSVSGDGTNTNGKSRTGTKTNFEAAANYRGEEPIYPASIVKLFYLVATHQWLEDKKISETDELKRAYRDMTIDSSNDATNYLIDVLTGTTSGPELSDKEMALWTKKRDVINKYFQKKGFKNINVGQKVWGDGSYGRDRVAVGKNFETRNKLTTNATARLLAEIVTGQCINPARSKAMMDLLARDFTKASDDIDNQATGFMGSCLPKNSKLWSKAGWMNTARHDAAYIELPNGIRFILVVFISNHGKEYWMLPTIASKAIRRLEAVHAK